VNFRCLPEVLFPAGSPACALRILCILSLSLSLSFHSIRPVHRTGRNDVLISLSSGGLSHRSAGVGILGKSPEKRREQVRTIRLPGRMRRLQRGNFSPTRSVVVVNHSAAPPPRRRPAREKSQLPKKKVARENRVTSASRPRFWKLRTGNWARERERERTGASRAFPAALESSLTTRRA